MKKLTFKELSDRNHQTHEQLDRFVDDLSDRDRIIELLAILGEVAAMAASRERGSLQISKADMAKRLARLIVKADYAITRLNEYSGVLVYGDLAQHALELAETNGMG